MIEFFYATAMLFNILLFANSILGCTNCNLSAPLLIYLSEIIPRSLAPACFILSSLRSQQKIDLEQKDFPCNSKTKH